jgi:hypothetical protein
MLYRTFAIYSSAERIKILLIGGYIVGVCATVIILGVITFTDLKGNSAQNGDMFPPLTCTNRK